MKKKLLSTGWILLLSIVVAGCISGNDSADKPPDGDKIEKMAEEGAENDNDENGVGGTDNEQADDESENNSTSKGDGALKEMETDNELPDGDDEKSDDELNLRDILGTAEQEEDMEYDPDKEYYILNMESGLSNFDNGQDVDEKWLAFAIPDGVTIPDTEEVPSGLVTVSLPDDHTGVAVKVPNLTGASMERVPLELPLEGKPDDNDPNKNLYLYDVDGDQEHAELIGEIDSTRDINFSVMDDTE